MPKAHAALFVFAYAVAALDALALYFLGAPSVYCNLFHGFLLTVYIVENWSLLQELKLYSKPTRELTIANKIQTEVIWQLKVKNFDLQQQLAKAKTRRDDPIGPPPTKYKLRPRNLTSSYSQSWHSTWNKHCTPPITPPI